LAKNETASMPKARINLDLDLAADEALDEESLQCAVARTYGGSARVQIDEIADKAPALEGSCRRQSVKCRVMFDNTEEARGWQQRSQTSRFVQDNVAERMRLSSDAVQFDAPAMMDEVDAITLKLDSDSSHILCGACLLYDSRGMCEKVVCYTDRFFCGGAVRHSGDTKVDGKSVHTISIIQSKVPASVTQMYFTLCSCGPADLSGFRNPSIMLYDQRQPDANLLEYSINQAANSVSCVMARLVRRPSWSADDRVAIACTLRRKGLSFLCIDLCLAMAAESAWAVQALGTEEWNLKEKICGSYEPSKRLIEAKFSDNAGVSAGQAV